MTVFPVVLDSCVLFPFYLRDTLLRAAETGIYRPHWSDKILDDATRNIVFRGKTTEAKAAKLSRQIATAFPECFIEAPSTLLPCMMNHEGDKHVLAVALVAKAEVIVTYNLKHFSPAALSPLRVEAQSPDDFLTNLYDLHPEVIFGIIKQQAHDCKNPCLSTDDLIGILGKSTPGFSARLLQRQRDLGAV